MAGSLVRSLLRLSVGTENWNFFLLCTLNSFFLSEVILSHMTHVYTCTLCIIVSPLKNEISCTLKSD